MNICQIALEKELKMESFYRQLAKETKNLGLKNIFHMMSDMEWEHVKQIDRITSGNNLVKKDLTINLESMPDTKNIMEKIKEFLNSNIQDQDISLIQIEFYKTVRDFEKETHDFYLSSAKETTDFELRNLLEKLAVLEIEHYLFMNELYEFVNEPISQLENAEFHNIEKPAYFT
ncbi:MAG: ferritin family protein [Oligoflexia bacterium]|nr:ferritin family protein [Oligoflexia bacterium]